MTKFTIEKISIKNLLESINDNSFYKKNQLINSFSSFDLKTQNNLAFIDKAKFNKINVKEIKASCVIVPEKIKYSKNFILNKNPRLLFEKICKRMIKNYDKDFFVNSPKGKYEIGRNTFISNFSKIESGVKIGNNVVIYKNSHIKKNTIISSGAIIGNIGTGPYMANGVYRNCAHLGGVIIERNSYIGSNTVITRGTLSNTIIGENSFISNLVNIGHNVRIGKSNLISSSVCIGGGTKTGKTVEIGMGATLNTNITIGNNCKIAMNTNVIKSLKKNEQVFGNPAQKIILTKSFF